MNYYSIVYNNGKWEHIEDSSISITNLGFQFGYGVFETVRFVSKKIFSLEKHFRRLNSALISYNIDFNVDLKTLNNIILEGIDRNDAISGTIKIIITPRIDRASSDIFIIYRKEQKIVKLPVKVLMLCEAEFYISRTDILHKSLNYAGNYIASIQAQNSGYFEPIFYNKDGFITEGAFRNIFFIRDDKLVTPPLSLGILPGTTRDSVISIANLLKIPFNEERIHIDTINNMNESFITSAGIGVIPCKWDQWSSNYPLTYKIKNKYNSIKKINNL